MTGHHRRPVHSVRAVGGGPSRAARRSERRNWQVMQRSLERRRDMQKSSRVGRSWISLSCLLFTAACSDGSSEESPTGGAPTPTPAAPEMTATPTAPAAAPDPAAAPAPTPGANEGAPLDADLEAPGGVGSPSDGADNAGDEAPADAPTPAEAGAPVPSLGCGAATAAASGRFTIDVAGTPRDFILALPDDYDAT